MEFPPHNGTEAVGIEAGAAEQFGHAAVLQPLSEVACRKYVLLLKAAPPNPKRLACAAAPNHVLSMGSGGHPDSKMLPNHILFMGSGSNPDIENNPPQKSSYLSVLNAYGAKGVPMSRRCIARTHDATQNSSLKKCESLETVRYKEKTLPLLKHHWDEVKIAAMTVPLVRQSDSSPLRFATWGAKGNVEIKFLLIR